MSLELTGKLVTSLPAESGQGAKGPWTKQSFIIETIEQYPKKVCIIAWNENVKRVADINPESTVKAAINIESREYNGKWYTDIRLWKIEVVSGSAIHRPEDIPSGDRTMNAVAETADPIQNNNMQEDDLPF